MAELSQGIGVALTAWPKVGCQMWSGEGMCAGLCREGRGNIGGTAADVAGVYWSKLGHGYRSMLCTGVRSRGTKVGRRAKSLVILLHLVHA